MYACIKKILDLEYIHTRILEYIYARIYTHIAHAIIYVLYNVKTKTIL